MSHTELKVTRLKNTSIQIVLVQPGQARCACGALLLKVCAPSSVEIKCRRCGQIAEVRLLQNITK